MERRTAFMKQMPSELRHDPDWFQSGLIENMNEEVDFFMFFYLMCNTVPENWHMFFSNGLMYIFIKFSDFSVLILWNETYWMKVELALENFEKKQDL